MPYRKPKFIVSLQPTMGLGPVISFSVTGNKAEKILAILDPDIKKDKEKKECSSGTLERFFER